MAKWRWLTQHQKNSAITDNTSCSFQDRITPKQLSLPKVTHTYIIQLLANGDFELTWRGLIVAHLGTEECVDAGSTGKYHQWKADSHRQHKAELDGLTEDGRPWSWAGRHLNISSSQNATYPKNPTCEKVKSIQTVVVFRFNWLTADEVEQEVSAYSEVLRFSFLGRRATS